MKKINYVVATIVNSVGFLLVFGTLLIMLIEIGRYKTEVTSIENSLVTTNSAYYRFLNGRTLNSDYSLWKKIDTKYKTQQLKNLNQDEFLRGVAVFQKAFWKKYYNKKNNTNTESFKNLNWEEGFAGVDKDLKEKIISRYPEKEELNKRLNNITTAVFNRLTDVRAEYEESSKNLYFHISIFTFLLLFNMVFYLRRTERKEEKILENIKESEIEFFPTYLLKLDDDKIVCYSNLLKTITPNIIEYKNWNDYFITNFSVVKNVSGEKIVNLRRSTDIRYKLQTSVNGNYRYISFVPISTVIKENVNTMLGRDSLMEIVTESIHRIELLYDRLKFENLMKNDAFVNENIGHKTDEMIGLVGSFYKRLAVLENKTIRLEVRSEVNKDNVQMIFSTKSVRLDPNTMRNVTNFNFSYYPQKIESLYEKNNGKVNIKNKYSSNKNFVCSELTVNFDLRDQEVKMAKLPIKMMEN